MQKTAAEAALKKLVAEIKTYVSGLKGPGVASVLAGMDKWASEPRGPIKPRTLPACEHHHLPRLCGPWANHPLRMPLLRYSRISIGFPTMLTPARILAQALPTITPSPPSSAKAAPSKRRISTWACSLSVAKLFYRDHHHAAPELYAPLTGPHGWRFKPGDPLDWKEADVPVWNNPWEPRATMTGDIPFLAIFCWTKDALPARKDNPFTRLAPFGERILKTPELIVTNADICTMDPLAPRVAALAVTDGRISALGPRKSLHSPAPPPASSMPAAASSCPAFRIRISICRTPATSSKARPSMMSRPSPSCIRRWPTSLPPMPALGRWRRLVHRHLHRSQSHPLRSRPRRSRPALLHPRLRWPQCLSEFVGLRGGRAGQGYARSAERALRARCGWRAHRYAARGRHLLGR